MDLHQLNLKWCFSVAFVAATMACSAQSQPDGSSILSQPVDDGVPSAASTLELPSNASSSPSFFGSGKSSPLPPPNTSAWQKALNDRKNWTLMTPEEIMGVQSPEQIFGLKELDPTKNLSPEQRYLKREENAGNSATSSLANKDAAKKGLGLFDQLQNDDPSLSGDGKKDDTGSSDFSRIFGSSQTSLFGPKSRSSQFGAATSAAASAKAKLAEDTEMARFRTLIGEVPQSEIIPPTTTTSLPLSAASPSLRPLANFDPFGHPLASQPKDLSQPTGLTPLTAYTGSYAPVKKAKKPSWEPQPAPWASGSSTPPTGPPMRKFY